MCTTAVFDVPVRNITASTVVVLWGECLISCSVTLNSVFQVVAAVASGTVIQVARNVVAWDAVAVNFLLFNFVSL